MATSIAMRPSVITAKSLSDDDLRRVSCDRWADFAFAAAGRRQVKGAMIVDCHASKSRAAWAPRVFCARTVTPVSALQGRASGGSLLPYRLDTRVLWIGVSQSCRLSMLTEAARDWYPGNSAPMHAQCYGWSPVAAPTRSRPFGARRQTTEPWVVGTGGHHSRAAPFASTLVLMLLGAARMTGRDCIAGRAPGMIRSRRRQP